MSASDYQSLPDDGKRAVSAAVPSLNADAGAAAAVAHSAGTGTGAGAVVVPAKPTSPDVERDVKPAVRAGYMSDLQTEPLHTPLGLAPAAAAAVAATEKHAPFSMQNAGFVVDDEPDCTVKLTRHVLTADSAKAGTSRAVTVRTMVGAQYDRVGKRLTIHTYPFPEAGCCGAPSERVYVPLVVRHSDVGILDALELAVAQLIGGVSPVDNSTGAPVTTRPPRRRILVLVNPFGGRGTAARVCGSVEPLLAHTGAEVVRLETQRAGHAHDIARDMKVGEYDTVALVSGDGLISEFVNGLFARKDWRHAVANVSIGVIPGGSGNGLAKSLLATAGDAYSPVNAAFLVAKGQARKLDVFTVTQPDSRAAPFVGFLSAQWAIASDVDFESEKWRSCCGGARFTWTAIVRMCCLRQYAASVQYLPAEHVKLHKPNWSTRKVPLPDYDRCSGSECPVCLPRPPIPTPHGAAADAAAAAAAAADRKDAPPPHKYAESEDVAQLEAYLTANTAPAAGAAAAGAAGAAAAGAGAAAANGDHKGVGAGAAAAAGAGAVAGAKAGVDSAGEADKWVTVNSSGFVMVWAQNLAWASYDMQGAPYGHMSDGLMDFLVVRDIGCGTLCPLFLDIESGTHVHSNAAEYIKVRAVRLTPSKQNNPQSIIGVDGEKLDAAPAEIRVFRGVLNVLAK